MSTTSKTLKVIGGAALVAGAFTAAPASPSGAGTAPPFCRFM